MRKILLLSVMSLAAFTCSANASTDTLTFTDGTVTNVLPPGGALFESYDSRMIGSTANFIDPGFASFSGGGLIEQPPSVNGEWATPLNDATPYLVVQAGQEETIAFNQGVIPTQFQMYWGSVDNFNDLIVNYVGGAQDIFPSPAPASGSQTDPASNGLVQVTGTTDILSVVLMDNGTNAFETDNFAIPVPGQGGTTFAPLPGTLALFAGGLALLGMAGARRRKRDEAISPSMIGAV